jgi:hypothetical protein
MTTLHGQSGDYLLFSDEEKNAVIIDQATNMVVEVGTFSLLASSMEWQTPEAPAVKAVTDLARGSLADLRVEVIVASSRMYTIPKAVQEEAQRGLEWRKEFDRAGTPVGMNTARRLAAGGQIGIEKVRHVAKYFPRHEVDKKAKGYKPGQDGFPSNGRIAWALWGGDSAWRWARAIVERENKKAMRAAGGDDFAMYHMATDYSSDVDAFKQAYELGEGYGPEFVGRTRMDGSGIDRLYKIDIDGTVCVWDGGYWDDLGHVDTDFLAYDEALDDENDGVEKQHILLDVDSALIISAHLQQSPYMPVSAYSLNAEEAEMVLLAADEIDWDSIDSVIVAAGEAPEVVDQTPGEYTPEERSQRARGQVRDKTGKFASSGSRVVVGGDATNGRGYITDIDGASGNVVVKLDSGQSITVPGNQTEKEGTVTRQSPAEPGSVAVDPVDTSGILAQPRAPIDRPNAVVPGGLPGLTANDLQTVIADFPAWVKGQRDKQLPVNPGVAKTGPNPRVYEKSDYLKALEKETGTELYTGSAKNHPLLQDFFKKKKNNLWYSPIISAAGIGEEKKKIEPQKPGKELTPETSDVDPMYVAIVSPDDPRAVLDLVAVVPANTNSTSPSTFKRVEGEWVKDDQILSDLNSPTPPPVVPLDTEVYKDVLQQVDGAMVAAGEGGLDRNRGKAEQLRKYWTKGRGAAKIRWGVGGDWKRCVKHLGKYLGPRAKGYCNLRHKEVLGFYPATHAKMLKRGRNNSVEEFIMEEPLYEIYGAYEINGPKNNKNKTIVTYEDLEMDLDEIYAEQDELFAHDWEPEDDIVAIIIELADYLDIDNEPDAVAAALVAEGGLDRNRGNAENLRRYWTVGKGALKIRWGTPGDWTRCYRHLAKYMGPRAKGYCALRHKEVTGLWTGDKEHRQMYGGKRRAFSADDIMSSEDYINAAILSAQADDARSRVLVAGGNAHSGAAFFIPLVIPEEKESGDGRMFEKEAISMRDLPLPLLWQIKTGSGHDGSVVVGRIDQMERVDNGIGNARGVFDSSSYGREAERMVREGFIRGVSADLDMFEANEEENDEAGDSTDKKIGGSKIKITKARVMAVTMVPKPAFQQCKILIEENTDSGQEQEAKVIPDGVYTDDANELDAEALVACGMVASSIPVVPPATWFTNPGLKDATPLTVTDEGRVFGHIAAWHVDHIGMSFGTKPPRSRSKYSYFHTGVVRTDDGKDVAVGQLTLAGGHASLEASAVEAVRHYDDTASAIADVHAGEDAHGIWVAGSLRPEARPEQIRALRASAPSGDWRPIKGHLELVAVCQVNVPGFPIARARVAGGQVYALVAAGAATLAKMKSDPLAELNARIERIEALEKAELLAKISAASAVVDQVRAEKKAELAAQAEELSNKVRSTFEYDTLGYISRQVREKLAGEGKALPDGSFPIRNAEELKNAIQAYGRSKPSKRAAVRRHIIKSARRLKKTDVVPEQWKTAGLIDDDVVNDIQARVASLKATSEFADISPDVREKLAKQGKALPDGSFPIRNVDDLKNAIKSYGRANEEDRAKVRKHITKRARALGKSDMIPEEWK